MFRATISVTVGEIVEREGFAFADLLPTKTLRHAAGAPKLLESLDP
jgi:hypothetical protein